MQAFMKAVDILAGDHRQRFLVSDHSVLTCIIWIRVPVSLALSSCHYVLRPRPGLGQASVSLGAPRMPTKPASSWPLKQGRKKCSKHGCDRGTSTVASGLGTHKEKKVCVEIHVQAAGSQICLQNICGQQRNSPMADPIFGSKYGPQNGVQNWIPFSFLLLGLCLGPVLGSRFGPKSGASHRKILLLPADVLQADLRRTSMSVSVNTCFFSLCVPICFLYSRGPFMAAMFLLVFWILFSGP